MTGLLVGELNYKLCKKIATIRYEEAIALCNAGQYSGAYYLAGYAIELAIKGYYCKGNKFPPKAEVVKNLYSHDLNLLLGTTGLKGEFDKDVKTNSTLQSNWGNLKDWSEESRYVIYKQREAKSLIKSVGIILKWIQTKW